MRQHRQELVLVACLRGQFVVGSVQVRIQSIQFAAALDDLGFHPDVVGAQLFAYALLPRARVAHAHVFGHVVHPVHDAEQLAVRREHGRVDGTPVTHLETAAVHARRVIALDGHDVRLAAVDHALQRARQVQGRIRIRCIRIVGEHIEQRTSDEIVARDPAETGHTRCDIVWTGAGWKVAELKRVVFR